MRAFFSALAIAVLASMACSRAPSAPSGPSAPAPAPPASAVAVSVTDAAASGSASAPLPPASSIYMGRALAAPMNYRGADWLERTDRDATEKPEHVLDVIGIGPTDVVADIGAGSGYFTERIAKRLDSARGGRVIATDLQPEMLAMIRKKTTERHLINVEIRLATEVDAALGAGTIDVALMVDVYHELPRPDLTLSQVKTALRAGGRLVLVEYRAEDPRVPIKPEHKMTLAQIKRELAAAAFTITKVDESLPQQRIVIATPP